MGATLVCHLTCCSFACVPLPACNVQVVLVISTFYRPPAWCLCRSMFICYYLFSSSRYVSLWCTTYTRSPRCHAHDYHLPLMLSVPPLVSCICSLGRFHLEFTEVDLAVLTSIVTSFLLYLVSSCNTCIDWPFGFRSIWNVQVGSNVSL